MAKDLNAETDLEHGHELVLRNTNALLISTVNHVDHSVGVCVVATPVRTAMGHRISSCYANVSGLSNIISIIKVIVLKHSGQTECWSAHQGPKLVT